MGVLIKDGRRGVGGRRVFGDFPGVYEVFIGKIGVLRRSG